MCYFKRNIYIILVEVVVTYPYDSSAPDELTIKVGDVITNVQKQDGGWWEGELNGNVGMFPDNFVKVSCHIFIARLKY